MQVIVTYLSGATLLLEAGADKDTAREDGGTALLAASDSDMSELVRMLKELAKT